MEMPVKIHGAFGNAALGPAIQFADPLMLQRAKQSLNGFALRMVGEGVMGVEKGETKDSLYQYRCIKKNRGVRCGKS